MRAWLVASLLVVAATRSSAPADAEPLTADRAVQIALQRNTQVIQADAALLDSKSGVWSAYSGLLPSFSAGLSRSGSFTDNSTGSQAFGSFIVPSNPNDRESYSTSPGISGRMSVLNLSLWNSLRSANKGHEAAKLGRQATRNDIVLSARRQFYEVVKAVHLSGVSTQSLKLSRDDERRVRALFEVGSVSKSDLLKARVRTAQSELDSLLADHAVTGQRIALATLLGVSERELGDVDTTLTAEAKDYDEASVLADARATRPDLRAAEADVKSSQMSLNAARWSRLPYVSASGSYDVNPFASSKITTTDSAGVKVENISRSEQDRVISGQISVNWDFFDGLATDARIASSRARLMRARETRDALVRNLEGEVHQAMLGYREAIEREGLARRTLESASENLNLVQQKYNVGSATILDLIDSQVQLQRAQSDRVSAMAAIRVAEATLERVRGRGE